MFDLYKYQRQRLAEPFRFWLRTTPVADQVDIGTKFFAVLDAWIAGQADDRGMVLVPENDIKGGLFGGGPRKLVPATTITPEDAWQVADDFVLNNVDLAFKLWADGFPPMMEIMRERETKVFSVIGMMYYEDTSMSSLVDLSCYLTEHVCAFARISSQLGDEWFPKVQRLERNKAKLATARANSIHSRKARAQEKRIMARQMAADYWKKKPVAKEIEVAEHIALRLGKGKASSIAKLIRGVRGGSEGGA